MNKIKIHEQFDKGVHPLSLFNVWYNGHEKGHGSFHTALMELYFKADGSNKAKLRGAFPNVFTKPYGSMYEFVGTLAEY